MKQFFSNFAGLVHMYMGILTTLSMETPLFSSCVFTGHQMASFGVLLWFDAFLCALVYVTRVCAIYSNNTQHTTL